jgi:hypothetical protein
VIRFFVLISGYLSIGFALLGALVSRAWGWSEYASPELYVVYYQAKPAPPYPFFMVDTNGSDRQWKLAAETGILTDLNCSPDGRMLAFLKDNTHLYVVSQTGLVYDRMLNQAYTALSVANNGTVVAFNPGNDALLIDPHQMLALVAPDDNRYGLVIPTSQGALLWHRASYFGLEVASRDGRLIASFPLVIFPKWLASEQLMTFGDIASIPTQRVLVDTTRQSSVRLSGGLLNGVFSPDGTRRTLNAFEPGTSNVQIVVADPFSDDHMRQLTHTPNSIYEPICFLAFPQPEAHRRCNTPPAGNPSH